MWTHFSDMHTGGHSKEKFNHVYIEAPKKRAIKIFILWFGHNPRAVGCPCCGENYAIYECETLADTTSYERNAIIEPNEDFELPRIPDGPIISLEEYLTRPDVKVIYGDELPKS